MIVLVYNNVVVGGAETLLLRQARWASKNNEVCLLCNSISQKMRESFEELNIRIVVSNLYKINKVNKIIKKLETEGHNIQIVEFLDYIMYFKFQFTQLIERTSIRAVYYSVLPINGNIFSHFRNIKAVNDLLTKYNELFFETNGFLFIDKDCCDGFARLNNLENVRNEDNIVLLPFEAKNNKKEDESISILSVARADFPFKGYLLGLVDAFEEINKENKYNMTIISYGKHIDRLKKKIESKNDKSITLVSETKPSELGKYYAKARVYVGTGTTVLEAASYGVPSILIVPDTNEFLSDESFDKNGELDVKNKGIKGVEILRRYLELNDFEYDELSLKTRKTLDKYDNEANMTKVFNREINEISGIVTSKDKMVFYVTYYVNLVLQKIGNKINKYIKK